MNPHESILRTNTFCTHAECPHTRPDGNGIDYDYNLRNLLETISTAGPPPVAEYTYNGRNQLHQTSVENGLFVATRGYDNAGRITAVTNGTLDTTGYTLSADGRRTAITRNGNTENYAYDNARQVSSASYTDLSTTQSWNYDANGNRITATTNSVTTNYTAKNVNEYLTISGGGFVPPNPSHDNNGNSLSLPRPDGTALTFTWNVNNELLTATNAAGDTATYQYDALGRRTKRSETISSVTTHTWFFTNGWNVELEHDGTNYTKRMTWGIDLSGSFQGAGGVGGLVMVEDLTSGVGTSIAHFPTYDGNGNITAWITGTGTVVARQRYDAFGNIIQQTGSAPSNYGFSTKPQEKVTSLHYYGYRYYDAITGRWPSRDPIEENGGINLYGFVKNEGVSEYDTLGLDVNISRNEGSGKNLADQHFGLTKDISDLLQTQYGTDKNILIDVLAGSKNAHTKDDIINTTKELLNHNYEKIFIFIAAHGQIVGENYGINDVISEEERGTKGHFITMDNNVLTIPLFSNLKLLSPSKIIPEINSCFYIPMYKHKISKTNDVFPTNGWGHKPNYLDYSKRYFKTISYADQTRFRQALSHFIDKKKKCKYAVAIFLGRDAISPPTISGYQ